jgi:hypothetical protein
MMSKGKIFLIAGGAVYVLLLGGLGFLLISSHSKFKTADAKIASKTSDYTRLKDSDPYPSSKNVNITFDNITAISNQLSKLTATISRDQFRWTRKKPDEFKDQLRKMRQELSQQAKVNRISLPENFWFGFDRYAEGEVPFPKDVPRLTEQLNIIEMMIVEMFKSEVKGLEVVLREEFEQDTTVQPSRSARNDTPSSGPVLVSVGDGQRLKNPKSGLVKKGEQYGVYTFRFVFRSNQEPLNDIINKIASNKMFMRIIGVQVDSAIPPLKKPEVVVSATALPLGGVTTSGAGNDLPPWMQKLQGSGSTNPTNTSASATNTVPEVKEEETYRISEFESPVTVTLDLEVFVFPTGESDDEEEAE